MIDHIVYAVSDLDRGVRHIEAKLGVTASPGGVHTGRGTHNALLNLGDGAYLEIIAPDPNQPDPPQPRPFGIDDIAVGNETDGVVAWCARSLHDLDDTRQRLVEQGLAYGAVEAMSRATPDGADLRWRLCVPSTAELRRGIPFFIDWSDTQHPTEVLPEAARLVRLVAPTSAHDEAIRFEVGDEPRLTSTGDTTHLSIEVATPNETVRL